MSAPLSAPRGPVAGAAAARAASAVKTYGSGSTAVTALDGVDVEFAKGRFTAIMGPSGSGKSTLMHCVAGLDTLTSGQVFIGDVELGSLAEKELTRLRRDRIGFVFQAFNLIPTLSAAENITLPIDLAGGKTDATTASPCPRQRCWKRSTIMAANMALAVSTWSKTASWA